MCGICGVVDFGGVTGENPVPEMTESLRHRGPDSGGTTSFDNCVLGHRRLSILDLSESAGQPMLSRDGLTALVFNGEIYNFRALRVGLKAKGHVFRTLSDTEVLLESYFEDPESFLQSLNGMFSFAIWDQRSRRLFLARDRLGKKPLYYCRQGRRLSFSSELPSLLGDHGVNRLFSTSSLCEYLLYDFIPAPHTIFKSVFKLPAAHYAVFDENGLSVQKYWKTSLPVKGLDYQEETSRLRGLLEESVRMRLVSDVPLGSFLSGGMDSTLVTALMCRESEEKINSFSVSFPGTSHDESRWSSMAACALQTHHHDYPLEYDIEALFESLVRHFGEPFGDSSAIPTWRLCENTRRHVTVALSGDGGDELFGGYERYLARRFQLVYDRLPRTLREKIIEPFIKYLPETTDYYGTSIIKKAKLFVRAATRIRKNPLAVVPRTFSESEVLKMTGIEHRTEMDPVILAAREWAGLDPVSHMMFSDIQTYLSEDILTKVDRMSMAHGLEVRSPLLDHRIVELACRIPLGFKIRGLTTKRILRDVAADRVPDPILRRSKYGFQVPMGSRLKGNLKEWALPRLLDFSHDVFRRDVLENLWQQHQIGHADHSHRLWLIMVFNEWFRQMGQ